jgi:hypothetical protein
LCKHENSIFLFDVKPTATATLFLTPSPPHHPFKITHIFQEGKNQYQEIPKRRHIFQHKLHNSTKLKSVLNLSLLVSVPHVVACKPSERFETFPVLCSTFLAILSWLANASHDVNLSVHTLKTLHCPKPSSKRILNNLYGKAN